MTELNNISSEGNYVPSASCGTGGLVESMEGYFALVAPENVDDVVYKALLQSAMQRSGRVSNAVEMRVAKNFLDEFGYGHIKCDKEFWSILAGEQEYLSTPLFGIGKNRDIVRDAEKMFTERKVSEAYETDARILIDFCTSYDEMEDVWYMILYRDYPRFVLNYTLGETNLREMLLRKGREIGIEQFISAHFDAGIPIEDLFWAGEVDPKDPIYTAGYSAN